MAKSDFERRLELASSRKGSMNCIGTTAFIMGKRQVEIYLDLKNPDDLNRFSQVGTLNPTSNSVEVEENVAIGVYDLEINQYVHMSLVTPQGNWHERQGRGGYLEPLTVEQGMARIREKYASEIALKKVEVRILK